MSKLAKSYVDGVLPFASHKAAARVSDHIRRREAALHARIAALEAELADIKEKGTSYMLEVDRLLQQAERDGLARSGSVYLHTKTVTDVVRQIFGEVH